MKCQNCGNELGPDEVFCGQCGAPNNTPGQQTEMMQQAPAPGPRSGLLGSSYRSGGLQANPSNQPFAPESTLQPNQSAIRQGPQQAGGFYQDATEAFPHVSGNPVNYPPGTYPQQGFPGNSTPVGGYSSGQFNTQQPFLSGNYVNSSTNFPSASYPTGQFGPGGYGSSVGLPGQPKSSNTLMIVGIVCLIFVLIAVGTLGTLFALRGSSGSPQAQATTTTQPAVTPTATPTPTVTPTPSPTPTVGPSPTATPDLNFGWCIGCTQIGFQVEYPNGWAESTTQDGYGIKFADNQLDNTVASFKTPGGTFSTPNDLINSDANEVQQAQGPLTVLSQPAPAPSLIGGQNWTYQSFLYQTNVQNIQTNIQITIYATISQNKGYVIELVAPQDQFANIQGQYFSPMLVRFQFVTPTQQ